MEYNFLYTLRMGANKERYGGLTWMSFEITLDTQSMSLSRDIINYEPRVALDGGVDGLDLIKKVIYKSNILLKRNGVLALEIGFGQYRRVSEIMKHYKFREYSKIYDYNSNVRCIITTKIDFY